MQKLYLDSENAAQRRHKLECLIWLIAWVFLLTASIPAKAADPEANSPKKVASEGQNGDAPEPEPDQASKAQPADNQAPIAETNDGFSNPLTGAPLRIGQEDILLILGVVVFGIIGLKKLFGWIPEMCNSWDLAPLPAPALTGTVEEQAFSQFAVAFRVGPQTHAVARSASHDVKSESTPAAQAIPSGSTESSEPKTPAHSPKAKAEVTVETSLDTAADSNAQEQRPSEEEVEENACSLPAESPE